jgi:hypothetical protein
VADLSVTPQGTQQAELGALLAGAVAAVARAQDVLDEHAQVRVAAYEASPPGSLALPPLWYAFDSVSIDIELSAEVVRGPQPDATTSLVCRTLNPVTVGIYGYSASAGTRVHLTLAPQRVVPNGPAPGVPEVTPSPT